MIPLVKIEVNETQAQALAMALVDVRDGLTKAIKGAVYDTAKNVKAELIDQIVDRVNIKRKDINEQINVDYPRDSNDFRATIRLKSSGRLPLDRFGAKKSTHGITYQIDKQAGPKELPGGFFVNVATSGKANKKVFRRYGEKVLMKKGRYKGKLRQPIGRPKGVSPYGVVMKNEIGRGLKDYAAERLEVNLDHRMNYLLKKEAGEIPGQ